MKTLSSFEFPPELQNEFKRAKKLEWITLLYLISTSLLVYLTMGTSQAMKTAWFEDLISLTPSVSFLIASRFIQKPTSLEFPFGFHRAVSIAYLCSSLALFSVGFYLFIDSATVLIEQDRATIGYVTIFGKSFWLGYLMIVVMLYGIFPALILGKKKLPIAEKLHDKNLYADAKMNKADWMTAAGTIVGVVGIGFGIWWLDPVAAILISLDILKDGITNLKHAVLDLIDQSPKTLEKNEPVPVLEKIRSNLAGTPWIDAFTLRVREEGHVLSAQAFIIPKSEVQLTQNLENLSKEISQLDWKLQDFTLTPVKELPSINA